MFCLWLSIHQIIIKYDFEAVYCIFKGSSEIWSDKVSLLHIKGTQRGGEHGGESRQSHGGAEGTKSDRAVVYVLLIALVINILRNLANHCFVMK